MPTDALLKFRAFGALSVVHRSNEALKIPTMASRRVLAYLLMHSDQPQSRAKLCATLWPDASETQARRWLSQALWQLRQAFAQAQLSNRIQTKSQGLQLQLLADDQFDVSIFLGELERCKAISDPQQRLAGLRRTVTLYSDELLLDWYEDWVVPERQRLQTMYFAVLEELVRLCNAQYLFDDALEYAQRMLRLDPLFEEMHREVMLLHERRGQPGKALQQYEQLRTTLEAELGGIPAPATEELKRRLLRQQTSTTAVRHAAPWVGRSLERLWLTQRLERLQRGSGGLVLLEGEPGIGKTRFLQEVAQDAAWYGADVFWSNSHSASALDSYGAIRQLLERAITPIRAELLREQLEPVWFGQLTQLLRPLRELSVSAIKSVPLEPALAVDRMRAALCQVMIKLADLGPQLLVFDDLHWADEASLASLPALLDALQNKPVLVVLSYRHEAVGEQEALKTLLTALDKHSQRLRLRLEPLDHEDARDLAEAVNGGMLHMAVFEQVVTQAKGNPFYLLELLQALRERALASYGEDHVPPPLPDGVRQHLQAKLEHLTSQARAVLSVAAVLEQQTTIDRIAFCADLQRAQVLQVLDQLAKRGWLRLDKEFVRLEHELLRQVAYDELSPSIRQELHARAAQLLEVVPETSSAELAAHWQRAAQTQKALECFLRGAHEATSIHAYAVAFKHADQAVVCARELQDAVRLVEALEARIVALSVLAQRQAVLDDIAELHSLLYQNPVRQVELQCQEARTLLVLGKHEQARQTAEGALAASERLKSKALRGHALTALGQMAMRESDLLGAAARRREALECFEVTADLAGQAEAHFLLGNTLIGLQDFQMARVHLIRAARLFRVVDHPKRQADTLAKLGLTWMYLDRHQRACSCLERALNQSRGFGDRGGVAIALHNLAIAHFFYGSLACANGLYRQTIDAYQDLGDTVAANVMRENHAIVLAQELGDWDQALEQAQIAIKNLESVQGTPLAHLAVVWQQRGDLAAAIDQLDIALNQARLPLSVTDRFYLGLQLARCYMDLHQFNTAERLLEQCENDISALHNVNLARELQLTWLDLDVVAKRLESAQQRFHKLSELGSGPPRLAYWFAWCHYRLATILGEDEVARGAIQSAINILSGCLDGFDVADVQRMRERVPLVRAIMSAWSDTYQEIRLVHLPRLGVPTGRPLRQEEWLEVRWTVSSPQDRAFENKVERRLFQLERLLCEAQTQGAAPTVSDLALALGNSEATIKRDLALLRQRHTQLSTRGSRKSKGRSHLQLSD